MNLPIRFDANEWFVLVSFALLVLLIIWIPRKIPRTLALIILMISAFLGQSSDRILGYVPINLYDTMDSPKHDLFDSIIYLVVYPLYGYLFVNVYERWKFKKLQLFLYLLIWIAITTLLDGLAVAFHVFHYKKWNTGLSLLVYMLIFPFILYFYHFIKKQQYLRQ